MYLVLKLSKILFPGVLLDLQLLLDIHLVLVIHKKILVILWKMIKRSTQYSTTRLLLPVLLLILRSLLLEEPPEAPGAGEGRGEE